MKIIFYILTLGTLLFSCGKEDNEYTQVIKDRKLLQIPQNVLDSLKGGEIILRKGGGFMSSQIVKTLKEPVDYSHCGIVVETDTGNIIIHSLGRDYGTRDGVQPATFTSFNFDAVDSSLCIIRPNVQDSLLDQIQLTALAYYDARYEFDYSFDLSTTDRLHCTEFIHNVLLDALNKEIFPIEKTETGVDCLLFKNFFNPDHFQMVYSMQEIPEIEFN